MAFGEGRRAVEKLVGAGADAVGKGSGGFFGAIRKGVGYTAGAVTGAVTGLAKRPGAFIKGTAALAVLAGIAGTAAYVLRKPRKADREHFEPVAELPPVMPDMNTMQPNTMMGMAPVEGPQVARVQQSRQGGMGGPGIGA